MKSRPKASRSRNRKGVRAPAIGRTIKKLSRTGRRRPRQAARIATNEKPVFKFTRRGHHLCGRARLGVANGPILGLHLGKGLAGANTLGRCVVSLASNG